MDGEFTGLKADGTELVSIALIKSSGEELYLELDYAGKLDDWVKENVVPYLSGEKVSKEEAKRRIIEFVGPDKPYLMSYYTPFDWMGICGLFGCWDSPFFWIPLDFGTILHVNGFKFDTEMIEFAKSKGIDTSIYKKHYALDDARLLKAFYELLLNL